MGDKNEELQPKPKTVPVIEDEIDVVHVESIHISNNANDAPLCESNDTEPENITNILKKEEQQHKHYKENIIVKRGTWIVVLIIIISLVTACISAYCNWLGIENDLFAEVIKLDTTALTLILGYLFGSKSND